MTSAAGDLPYLKVWVWLVALLAAGVFIFVLPIPRAPAVALIFVIAAAKAILVMRDYMHLRQERLLIYAIFLIPVLFAIGFILVLIPDIVFHR